jgi:hypothetical protein
MTASLLRIENAATTNGCRQDAGEALDRYPVTAPIILDALPDAGQPHIGSRELFALVGIGAVGTTAKVLRLLERDGLATSILVPAAVPAGAMARHWRRGAGNRVIAP